ncbi:MAG: hypothetical protein AMXMBFR83_00670 [Phycisphaerae bacterium]
MLVAVRGALMTEEPLTRAEAGDGAPMVRGEGPARGAPRVRGAAEMLDRGAAEIDRADVEIDGADRTAGAAERWAMNERLLERLELLELLTAGAPPPPRGRSAP